MTAPLKLSGATNCVTIDGVDLHSMGMTVLQVRNPCPQARDSSFQISERDGDFDYTKYYGVRTMTISGNVIGNDRSNLLTHIDELKAYFRLKKSGEPFKLVFQNQTDRYWTCRFQSLEIGSTANWFNDHTAAFTLSLKCVKPYAEATSVTSENIYLHCLQNKIITYAGTVDAPLALKISQRFYENLLEKQAGNCNENYALWTYSNASGANEGSTNIFFGDYSIKITRTAAGEYYAEIDVNAQISDSKYYVFGSFLSDAYASSYLEAIITGGLSDSSSFGTNGFNFMKIGPNQLAGKSGVKFRIRNNGGSPEIQIDGAFIYEITAAEYADADYFPPPYQSDPSGDDFVPPKNPSFLIHRNVNLFRYANGDDTAFTKTGAATVHKTIRDPFSPGEKSVFVCTKADGDGYESAVIYVTPGQTYQLTFDYFIEKISGSFWLGFYGLTAENGPTGYTLLSGITSPAVGSGWIHNYTSETYRVTIPKSFGVVRFVVWQQGSGNLKMYVKNIQIARSALLADPLIPYVTPDIAKLDYTGTIAADDSLLIDSDNFTSDYFAYAGNAVTNGMANLSGSPLVLAPGLNSIRYNDSRKTAAAPEAESCGGVNCSISYRARFL
jgi:predicted phage tail component-like protein